MMVKPKTLLSLKNILNGSIEDSKNIIVYLGEMKSTLSKLKKYSDIWQIIKNVLETIGDEVEYAWFYL